MENYKEYGDKMAVEKQSVAEEVMENLIGLSHKALNVAERLENKLAPVMTQPALTAETKGCGSDGREYPPLFSDMKDHMTVIEIALHRIEYSIDRTGL